MKYFLIAGEASGDLHGSNLIRAIKREDPEAEVRAWGGQRMEAAGAKLLKHYRELSFMGFLEVLKHLPAIFRNIAACKRDIAAFRPDALIFIDFSGFNLRVAKWARQQGYRTHYYISPQVWATREGRVQRIRRDIDAMYVILPFEKQFYEEKHNMPVHFIGHPLIDAMQDLKQPDEAIFRRQYGLDKGKPLIGLLPGSRRQEVEKVLPVMIAASRSFPEYQFAVAGAPSLDPDYYDSFLSGTDIKLVRDQTYPLLQLCRAALVTSGTATLETALLKVPQVVCYKGGWISYQIAKRLIQLRFISLVNLIMDREVVPELIQNDLTPNALIQALSPLLEGPERELQLQAYEQLQAKLGGPGASAKGASLIVDFSRQA